MTKFMRKEINIRFSARISQAFKEFEARAGAQSFSSYILTPDYPGSLSGPEKAIPSI